MGHESLSPDSAPPILDACASRSQRQVTNDETAMSPAGDSPGKTASMRHEGTAGRVQAAMNAYSGGWNTQLAKLGCDRDDGSNGEGSDGDGDGDELLIAKAAAAAAFAVQLNSSHGKLNSRDQWEKAKQLRMQGTGNTK